jgi:hypothetical protein
VDFGFSHCYHLHLSLFPWETASFSERMARACGLMKRAGATSFRPHVHWNRVEPLIENPGLKARDVTDKMVSDYAAGSDGGITTKARRHEERTFSFMTVPIERLHGDLGSSPPRHDAT